MNALNLLISSEQRSCVIINHYMLPLCCYHRETQYRLVKYRPSFFCVIFIYNFLSPLFLPNCHLPFLWFSISVERFAEQPKGPLSYIICKGAHNKCPSKLNNMTEKDRTFLMWRGREMVRLGNISTFYGISIYFQMR